MRFLSLHVNSFCCTITTKGRSQVYEAYDDPVTRVDDALLVLASVERGDERNPQLVAERASAELVKLAAQLKATTVVLHPFCPSVCRAGRSAVGHRYSEPDTAGSEPGRSDDHPHALRLVQRPPD